MKSLIARLQNIKSSRIVAAYSATMFAIVASPAFAQFATVSTKLNTAEVGFAALGVTLFSAAGTYVGYKMAFAHAKFADVSHVLIGGAIAAGASGIAAWAAS